MPGTRSSCAAALRAALFLLLALGSVPGASAQGSTLSASLADNACLTDDHCGDGAFCTPPVLDRPGAAGAVTGQCLPCWMCCSLQGSQLAAASSCAARRCTCDLGAPCATPSPVAPPADAPSPPTPTCTAGLECRDQTCQACRGCEWSPGGCSSSCTSLLSLVDYVERPGGIVRQIALLPDSPDVLFVQQWVAQYSGVSLPLDSLIHAGTGGEETALSPWAVLARGASFSSSCYAGMGRELRAVVAPGCPCDPGARPPRGTGMCPAGYQCATGAYSSDPTLHTCLPCPTGTYCPTGTGPIGNVADFLCKEGYYCPVPSLQLGCPAGEFCPLGSTHSRSCQYLTLFAEEISSVPVYSRSNVLSELVMERRPWGGNLCPALSQDPFRRCPKGEFCETPAEVEVCPAGSKCPRSSTEPTPCDSFVLSCAAGTEWGSVSVMGIILVSIIAAGLLVMVALIKLAYAGMQRRQSNAMQKTDNYMKVKRIILETRLSLNATHLMKMLKSPMHVSEQILRAKGPVALEFDQLGLQLRKGGANVLDGVCGRFEPRKLIAIMGPSGAGKSTFLNVLCGKAASYGKVTGVLKVNGQQVRSVNQSPGKRNVGFVPQDDIVHEDLTVRENIWFSAMARLPSNIKLKQRRKIVEEVLFSLKLDHIEHSIVGSVEKRGISGGQRKRVNIGLELSALPTLLFLDEPTSGLDSTASTDVLDTLKHCAQLGMTIMTVIHQPRYSIFTGCDDVLFLGKGGRTVYLGPTSFAASYFERLGFRLPPNDNPADFCIDVISGGMRREGDMNFKPGDLFDLWTDRGRKAVNAYMSDFARPGRPSGTPKTPYRTLDVTRPTIVMPRDIECMTNIFHDIDVDGDGLVTAGQVMEYFEALELDMVEEEVAAFCAGRGQMTKEAFLALMRHGPQAEPTPAKGNRKIARMVTKAIAPIRALSRGDSTKSSTASGSSGGGASLFRRFASFGVGSIGSGRSSEKSHSPSSTRVGASKMSVPFTPGATSAGGPGTPSIRVETPGQEGNSPAPVERKRSAFYFTPGATEDEVVAESVVTLQDASPPPQGTAESGLTKKISRPASRLARATNAEGEIVSTPPGKSVKVCFSEDAAANDSPWLSRAQVDTEEDDSDSGEGWEDTHVPAPPVYEAEVSISVSDEPCPFTTPSERQAPALASPSTPGLADGYSSDENVAPVVESTHAPAEPAAPEARRNCGAKLLTDGLRFLSHYGLICHRRAVQWVRAWPSKVLTYLLLAGSGALLGVILRFHTGLDVVPLRAMLALLTMGLLCGIPSLQVFSNARAMWWRERSSGISPMAYALAGVTVDTFDVAIRPLVFMCMFYYFILPAYSLFDGFRVAFATSWYVSGLAYMLSALLAPAAASISLVCASMLLGGLFNGVLPTLASMAGEPMYYLVMISFVRWGIEALTILEFSGFPSYQQPPAAITLAGIGYCGLSEPLKDLIKQSEAGLSLVLDEDEIAQQVGLLKTAAASAVGDETFITMQCREYVHHSVFVMIMTGLAFRAVAFLALRWTGKRA